MEVVNHLYPTQDRIAALMGNPSGDAIVMLNLLKFRDKAVYADGRATTLSGPAVAGVSYRRSSATSH